MVKKYKLVNKKERDKYRDYTIKGLKMAYYRSPWENGRLESFGGACGLLKNENYPGYCTLCMTYHSFNNEKVGNTNLPKPVYVVEFSPLFNENGEIILIKFKGDEVFTTIDRGGYRDYDTNEIVDATLTFWINGAFKEQELYGRR